MLHGSTRFAARAATHATLTRSYVAAYPAGLRCALGSGNISRINTGALSQRRAALFEDVRNTSSASQLLTLSFITKREKVNTLFRAGFCSTSINFCTMCCNNTLTFLPFKVIIHNNGSIMCQAILHIVILLSFTIIKIFIREVLFVWTFGKLFL